MSHNQIVIRQARKRQVVYVSLDGGKSWIVIHPDGHTTEQWREPSQTNTWLYVTEWCCEHDCEQGREY